jgi:hypothetical protein
MRSYPVIGLAVMICATAAADTIEVSAGESIQAAIAGAGDGDVVLVGPGTYHEKLDLLGKAITVRSTDGPAVTTIDATGLGLSAVTCASGEWLDTVLEGFTVTGGIGTPFGGKRRGGGMIVEASNPVVRGCVFTGNTADAGGGMLTWAMHYGVIEGCVFESNTGTAGGLYGGAGLHVRGGAPTISGCVFRGNTAQGAAVGGGMAVVLGSATITDSLFVGNVAQHGGGLSNREAQVTLTNCTFADNAAVATGGAMRSLYSTAATDATNSIFWANDTGTGDPIVDEVGAITTIRHGTVEGGWSGAGSAVTGSDPLFADAPAGNYRLGPGSPCIDAGDDLAVTSATDLDGNDRIAAAHVDVGAYERPSDVTSCLADFDGSGAVDLDDLVSVLAAWGPCACPQDVDGSGAVDFEDLLETLLRWGPCDG